MNLKEAEMLEMLKAADQYGDKDGIVGVDDFLSLCRAMNLCP